MSTQVSKEILVCDTHGTKLKLNHVEPVNKDVDIKLPITTGRMEELQQSDSYIKDLLKQRDKNDLDKKIYTMDNWYWYQTS